MREGGEGGVRGPGAAEQQGGDLRAAAVLDERTLELTEQQARTCHSSGSSTECSRSAVKARTVAS